MIVYGAGLAGLIAATMIKRTEPVVVREAQPSLPNNHEALLRFRSDAVSRATGISFRKVRVRKAVVNVKGELSNTATLADENAYSTKVIGIAAPRSIGNLDTVERYIAPPNFVELLAKNLKIEFQSPLMTAQDLPTVASISTIPMPVMMDLLMYTGAAPKFEHRGIWTYRQSLKDIVSPELCQTVYCAPGTNPIYRASIVDRQLIIESTTELAADSCTLALQNWFGIDVWNYELIKSSYQPYGKLLPLAASDDTARRAFIMAMSDQHKVYSVGRFATWRQILLDDVVHDVEQILRMIESRDAYSDRLKGTML